MPLSAFSYCLSPSSSFHLRTPFCTTYCLFPKSFCSFSFKFAYNSSKLGSWRTSPNFTKEEPTIIETECGHNLLLDGAKKKKRHSAIGSNNQSLSMPSLFCAKRELNLCMSCLHVLTVNLHKSHFYLILHNWHQTSVSGLWS